MPLHHHIFFEANDGKFDYTFGDVTITIYDAKIKKCESCDEERITAVELGKVEKRLVKILIDNQLMNGDSFRFIRKVAGINRIEVAKMLDLPVPLIIDWEKGLQKVSPSHWCDLASTVKLRLSGKL